MNYVLYHSACYDGFGAAFAAWKKMGDTAKYIPVSYGFPVPEMPDAENIYILDFSYPEEVIVSLSHRAQVLVLDHHKTAEENLRELARRTAEGLAAGDVPNPAVIFDMEKSGALLAWEHFHSDPPPLLIQHISDRDLWQFKLHGSALIHKALVSFPMDFKLWDTFNVETLKLEGHTCERLYTQLVDNIVKSSWIGKLDGKAVPMVNTSIAWSEVGAALLEKYGPSYPVVASFTVFEEQVMWSLRSLPDYDCSGIAKKFGGGGHKNAAGFKTARY